MSEEPQTGTALTRVRINSDLRPDASRASAGFDDVSGAVPAVGDDVLVYSAELALEGPARVSEVDEDEGLIVLELRWDDLVPVEGEGHS